MNDVAHEQTDKELKRIEKLITQEYKQAGKELESKLNKHYADFARKDAEMQKQMDNGIITEQQYKQWRIGQMATGKRWENLRDSMTETLVNADKNATKLIQGQSIKAYGDNMNYGTYEVEHGSKIDTGFILYDERTIANLLQKDPKIIPMPRLDIPKDELWNRRKLTSAVTQGILQGESIPKIADRLQNVAMMDRNSAIRNARTYTTAAENKGRIDSYERANDLGIQTNKKWIATLDDRTRMEHRHLDNMSVPNDEAFEVDGYSIDYPGDPSAEPEMFYNCRCTLVADIVNYDYKDERNDEKLGDMSYEEWKHAKDVESEDTAEETPEDEKASDTAWIDRIKEIQGMSRLDEDAIKEAGHLIAEQVHSDYLDNLEKEKAELDEKVNQAFQKYQESKKKVDEIRYSPEYKEAERTYRARQLVWNAQYFNSVEDAEAYLKQYTDILAELQATRTADYEEYARLFNLQQAGDTEQTANALVNILSKVREMGSDGLDIAKHLGNSKSAMRGNVEWAYSKYPRSWVEQSIKEGTLKIKKADRGYYSDWESVIAISGDGDNKSNKTAIHELGHRMENVMIELLAKEGDFYDRRTQGERLEWLGEGYAKTEKTRKDDFLSPYMGKDYGGSAYELCSMGFEYAYCDPTKLAQDKDMEEWIYGLLATMP